MNIIFWLIVAIVCALLWFLLAFMFRPLGRFIFRIWDDAVKEIQKKDSMEGKE